MDQEIKQEFNGVKQEFNGVKQEFNGIKQEFVKIYKKFDEVNEKIDTNTRSIVLLEEKVVDGNRLSKDIWSIVKEKPSKTELLCDDHEERIKTLEYGIKKITK